MQKNKNHVPQAAWNEVENALDVAELLFNRQVELEMRDAPDNEELLVREEVICLHINIISCFTL